MKRPLNAVFYGNCQIMHLSLILSEHAAFKKAYEIQSLKQIHQLAPEEAEWVYEKAAEADLFVYQPVTDAYGPLATDKVLKYLKSPDIAVSVPVLHFSGYWPETVYIRTPDGKKILTSSFCDYHDLNIMIAYHQGRTVEEFVKKIRTGFYDQEFMEFNASEAIKRLRVREAPLTLKIVDHIEAHWKKERLFYSINHCKNSLFYLLADQLLNLLGIDKITEEVKREEERLAFTKLPVYPELISHFNFGFPNEDIIINRHPYTWPEYVEAYYRFYEGNPGLVSYNLHAFATSGGFYQKRILSLNNFHL